MATTSLDDVRAEGVAAGYARRAPIPNPYAAPLMPWHQEGTAAPENRSPEQARVWREGWREGMDRYAAERQLPPLAPEGDPAS